ncbi:PIN domain-containing protein [Streptomyces decoyicus]|uniref:PIN domain-containing protein n=1 Tax=Streptomyces decoyicus TaxID=249567 RepID=A0ABZ1FJ20_9ACTN|nr:PIN domain-containing protein [Streptomyces decoyicus]WSB70410.1 PIN domain-containing protein [Streptomyces decoyicus]
MNGPEDEYPLIRQYRDWIQSSPSEDSPDREQFFTQGTVVLDTNVLLSLYEYTPAAREQVLEALRSVQHRLWLPHQVGLEFVQNRHRVIIGRKKALEDASRSLQKKLGEARTAIVDARKLVQDLLIKYAQDSRAKEALESEISAQTVKALHSDWSAILSDHIQNLKQHDLAISSVNKGDPVLSQVAVLFGDKIAEPPDPAEVRRRVDEASSYRFPNRIPPGFADEGKGTPLSSSGDYLLWEETISHMADSPDRSRLLFVSNDTKDDWYQPAGNGLGSRPWPSLASELRLRTGAELRIETPGEFYRGVNRFLDAKIAAETYAEIDRAAKNLIEVVITEQEAVHTQPRPDLISAAFDAAGLDESMLDSIGDVPSRLLFTWWLIGVTAQLDRRPRTDDEPDVSVAPATRADVQPEPNWLPGRRLHLGEWPYRSSSWIAPWFAQTVTSASRHDRQILQQLAARQLDSERAERG